MEQIKHYLIRLFCFPIRCYQVIISPFIKPCCRFYPSCSQYMLTALKEKGIIQGLWMGFKRILRCNPWCMGGYDPVLPKDEND